MLRFFFFFFFPVFSIERNNIILLWKLPGMKLFFLLSFCFSSLNFSSNFFWMHDLTYWSFCQTPLASLPLRETKKREKYSRIVEYTAGLSKTVKIIINVYTSCIGMLRVHPRLNLKTPFFTLFWPFSLDSLSNTYCIIFSVARESTSFREYSDVSPVRVCVTVMASLCHL